MSTAWTIGFAVLAFFVFFLGLLELGTLRRVADVLERAEIKPRVDEHPAGGLEPGSPVPAFTGELSGGGRITSEELVGSPYLVVFARSGCAACNTLLRELLDTVGFGARVLVVVNDFTDAPELVDAAGITVVRQVQRGVARAFKTSATPHAFMVDANGMIAANRITNSLADLRQLLNDAPSANRRAEKGVALFSSTSMVEGGAAAGTTVTEPKSL